MFVQPASFVFFLFQQLQFNYSGASPSLDALRLKILMAASGSTLIFKIVLEQDPKPHLHYRWKHAKMERFSYLSFDIQTSHSLIQI